MADSINPYAPPTADEVFAPEVHGHVFKPSDGLASTLRALLALAVALEIISAVSGSMQLGLLERMDAGGNWTDAEAAANDQRVMLVRLVGLVMLLAAGITWFVWQARVSKNARALGAEDMLYGPNAWGWFFCPVINLWRPLQVIQELWTVTSPDDAAPPPRWLLAWWLPWILAGILGQISARLVTDDVSVTRLIRSTQLDMASSLMVLVAGVVAIVMITQITQRERARAAQQQRPV